jgi:hypothetical protein
MKKIFENITSCICNVIQIPKSDAKPLRFYICNTKDYLEQIGRHTSPDMGNTDETTKKPITTSTPRSSQTAFYFSNCIQFIWFSKF